MKIIDAYWENIVQINCNCLGGDDYIQFQRDKSYHENINKEAYYVKFVDNNFMDFKNRLKIFFKLRKNKESFISGENQAYNGMYFNFEQIKELYSILYNDSLNNKILLNEDIEIIKNWLPKKEFEKYPWTDDGFESLSTWVVYKSEDDLVLSIDLHEENNKKYITNFKISWAFNKITTKKDIKDYTRRFLFNKRNKSMCQENELFLYKNDLIELFGVINYIINNIKIYKNSEILAL